MKKYRRELIRNLYLQKSAKFSKEGYSWEGLSAAAMDAHFFNKVIRRWFKDAGILQKGK